MFPSVTPGLARPDDSTSNRSTPRSTTADQPLSLSAAENPTVVSGKTLRVRAGLLGVVLVAFAVGVVGIGDEGYVTLHGDMARYLMNGAYALDLATDRPFASVNDLIDYTRLYYARYPALSLGHHPLLLPAAEVPVFAVFGLSVASARIVILLSLIVAVAFLYCLVNEIYGLTVAVFAAGFFATSPFVTMLTQSVMSEIPTLALIMASAFFLHRYCLTLRRGPLAAFVVATVLSLYAKQLAIFVFPAFFMTAALKLGIRRLLRTDVLLAVGAIVILSLPLVPLTFVMSPGNVATVVAIHQTWRMSIVDIAQSAVTAQLSTPVLLAAACGTVAAIVNRDRRALWFVLWVASVLGGLFVTRRVEPPRYAIYWVPALAILAASVVAGTPRRAARWVLLVLLGTALGLQARTGARQRLVGGGGYEEAARFVLASSPGPTVLFSGDVDTGFFSFFVRKHDPARQLVVLRSDKVLTTSRNARVSVEDRIERREQIYDVLRRFGVRYVVLEDRPSQSRVLEWLREELHSNKFVERKRIAFATTDPRLRGQSLAVYEFTDATPPDKDAVLDMRLPLVGQSVTVKLSDLIERKYLR